MTLEERLEELMSLSEDERLELSERLLLSVPAARHDEIEQAWLEEAARRADELQSGKVAALSEEEFRARVKGGLPRPTAENISL